MLSQPEKSKMKPQMKIAGTEMLNLDSKENVEESLNDRSCKTRWKLTKKRSLILLILIGIIVIAGVTCAVVYYPREPTENSVQQLYVNQKKLLQDIGCSPKPVVKNIRSVLSAIDDLGDYEIEERKFAIFQCNDNSSYCGVNENCTCEPTKNGQTNATVIIKFRDRKNKNSKWQYIHRTLNIMNHTECVPKAV